MSRELDAEIAELLGWDGFRKTTFWDTPSVELVGLSPGTSSETVIPHYSSNLNVLMELVRSRWPDAYVHFGPDYAAVDWVEDRPTVFGNEGNTDAERLANAVVAALRAEKEEMR